MQSTPRSGRLHIAIFGRRNAGKSSLINALSSQEAALVSDVPGTTTDPVYKAMEILPIGPVCFIDTAGLDDEGTLGELRIKRTMKVLSQTDVALLIIDSSNFAEKFEEEIFQKIKSSGIPVVAVINKSDISTNGSDIKRAVEKWNLPDVRVSSKTGSGIEELKEKIIEAAKPEIFETPIAGDLIKPGDTVITVIPIDKSAPKGRLILPQVMTIRDILDHDGRAVMVKEDQLCGAIKNLKELPKLVITDSQIIERVKKDTPPGILFTSFSILFARYRGDINTLVEGAKTVENLKPGDEILIAEACTHHPTSDDIGRSKIPRWLNGKAGGSLKFSYCVGGDFPPNLEKYKLVIHCGACMINRKAMLHRIMEARKSKVPIVNYGVLISYIHNVLEDALKCLKMHG